MSCSFLEGFLMNEKGSESQGLMFWIEILFKNVNKEFSNYVRVQTTSITYCKHSHPGFNVLQ